MILLIMCVMCVICNMCNNEYVCSNDNDIIININVMSMILMMI